MDNKRNGSPPRVLVVENDWRIRRALRFSLEEAGFDITETPTGGQALRVLETEPPEAVVLDVGLANGLGGAVLAWLRQHADSSTVWIVMSALDAEDATRRYGPLGNHFMVKPFNPWDLVGKLCQLLSFQGKHQCSLNQPVSQDSQ